MVKKEEYSYIKRDAWKHSVNDIRAGMESMSKPAATARANAIPCSLCRTDLRVSKTLKSWTLKQYVKKVNTTQMLTTCFSLSKEAQWIQH